MPWAAKDCSDDRPADRRRRASAVESSALSDLLASQRDRLVRMVQLRMDPRLHPRMDASDIVQESLLDAAKRYPEYVKQPKVPFYLWLRTVVEHRLLHLHREHLGVQARDVRREVPLDRQGSADASSAALVSILSAAISTPSMSAARIEEEERLHAEIEKLDPMDREVLLLRHFEQLSNREAAHVLGISESASTKRHLRALVRLRRAIEGILPDLKGRVPDESRLERGTSA